jgi:hypothetical protein
MQTQWQKLKKRGNAAALASYQEQKLHARDAWQFLTPVDVKILSHTPKTNKSSQRGNAFRRPHAGHPLGSRCRNAHAKTRGQTAMALASIRATLAAHGRSLPT